MVEKEKVSQERLNSIGEDIIREGHKFIGEDQTIASRKMTIAENVTLTVQRQPAITVFREANLVTIVRRPYGSRGVLVDVHAFYGGDDVNKDILIVRMNQVVDKESGSTGVKQPKEDPVNVELLMSQLDFITGKQTAR